jgi:uncharacterized damage-inducible protein DinB
MPEPFGMRDTLAELLLHKSYATSVMLAAVRGTPAADDPETVDLLHHMLLANRFWLLTVRGETFAYEEESQRSTTFDDLVARYERLRDAEHRWVMDAADGDLERVLTSPSIPGGRCTVLQAWLQVCLHTHGHRAQIATLLRRHGGQPPVTDFIAWVATIAELAELPESTAGATG